MSVTPPRTVDWVLLNLKIGCFSLSGSSRVMLYQEEVVERRQWMTLDEFQEALTLAQMLPGPNVVNLAAYLGARLLSAWASAVGILMLALPGSLLAIPALWLLNLENPHVRELVRGLTIGSTAILVVFLAKFASSLQASGDPGVPARRPKLVLRGLLGLALGAAGFLGLPLVPLLAAGALACLVLEFAV